MKETGMTKRCLSLLVMAVMLLTSFAVPAFAADTMKAGDIGETTTDRVLFRKTASTSGDHWCYLPAGWQMKVTGTKTAEKILWYKVSGGTPDNPDRTYTGYIHSGFFVKAGTESAGTSSSAQATATPKPASSISYSGTVQTVKTGVNIRKDPAGAVLTGRNEDKIPINTVLDYTDGPIYQGGYNWVKVTYKGVTGYIRSDCWEFTDGSGLIPADGQPAVTAAPSATGQQGTIKLIMGGVNLRHKPDGEVITRLSKNTVLPFYSYIAASGDKWYEVYSAEVGAYGYIMSSMAKVTSGTAVLVDGSSAYGGSTSTASSSTATSGTLITTVNMLNVRKTPSMQADTLGQMANSGVTFNFTATRVAGGIKWYRITYKGNTGWLNGNFVRVTSASSTSGGSGSTGTPVSANPTAIPNIKDLSDVAVTILDKVRIRASASMSGKEINMVQKNGSKMAYLGRYVAATKSNPYNWYNVKYGTTSGWMRGDCMRILTNEEKRVYALTGDVNAPQEAEYRTLKKGDTGDDVKALQQKLVQLGYLTSTQVTSTYTSATETAVLAFQKDHGLTKDGIAGEKTQHALFNTVPVGTYDDSTVTANLYPVELVDWFKGDIQTVWAVGTNAVITDVQTRLSFRAQRIYGGNHADCEPLTKADTAVYCQIFRASSYQDILDRYDELQPWRRRPLWVTVGGRTFAASMYGVPHNDSGDRISNNNFTGQFCVHFVNSRTHTSNRVDTDTKDNAYYGHQSAIQDAYNQSISGKK